MPKNNERLFVGFEAGTGREVWIPYFHMLVAGTTQKSGKTTVLKTLARQAAANGYKILIFDSKSNAVEFEGFGEEIPICLRETTDSLTLLGLCESIMGRKLPSQYLATLSRVAERAKDFKGVLENAQIMERKTHSPFVQDVARVLIELLTRLIAQTADKVTTATLELKYPINRITMNKFALEGQQMIIKTAFEDALNYEKVIVILDEASKFCPQKYRSACDRAINHFVTQGAITQAFLWMSTQYLATTSKDQMKAMDVKLLGRQSHDTECEHTIDLVPRTDLKITNDTVMGLKLGHFIVVADETVRIVYTCPENADRHECQEVALGKRQPENIHYRLSRLLSDDEVRALNKMHKDDKVIRIEVPPEPAPPPPPPPPRVELPQKKIDETPARRKPSPTGKPLPGPLGERMELLEHNIEALRQRLIAIEQDITKFNASQGKIDVALENAQTEIVVAKTVTHLKATDADNRGKILMLAKEGFFKDQWHPLRKVVQAFEARPWTADDNLIKKELYAMTKDGVLAVKQNSSREYLYTLNANVTFTEA